ncbi:MAG: hypothetical protein ACI909_000140 [Planctomycetota bacterium]|jgi:hypothetical protein
MDWYQYLRFFEPTQVKNMGLNSFAITLCVYVRHSGHKDRYQLIIAAVGDEIINSSNSVEFRAQPTCNI